MLTMSNIVFAEWVRDQRKKRRLSQTELATALGVKPSHVSRIEIGERGTSVELLIKLSEFFKYPLEEIVYMSSGYKVTKSSDKISKMIEQKIRGFRRKETKERALELLNLLSLQEEQAEHNETSSQKKTAELEIT